MAFGCDIARALAAPPLSGTEQKPGPTLLEDLRRVEPVGSFLLMPSHFEGARRNTCRLT